MTCKHFCEDFDLAPTQRDVRIYAFGYKRCDKCEVVYRTDAINCACCGRHLSDQPASHKAKLAFRKFKESMTPERLKEAWADIEQCRINKARIASAKKAVAMSLGI